MNQNIGNQSPVKHMLSISEATRLMLSSPDPSTTSETVKPKKNSPADAFPPSLQPVSTRVNAPTFVFGSSDRAGAAKVGRPFQSEQLGMLS
jgi:hypothetical protein